MNVKSKFDTEEEYHDHPRKQYMRGMCSTPLGMIAEATRIDASNIKGPKFLQRLFRAIGWKTRAESKE